MEFGLHLQVRLQLRLSQSHVLILFIITDAAARNGGRASDVGDHNSWSRSGSNARCRPAKTRFYL